MSHPLNMKPLDALIELDRLEMEEAESERRFLNARDRLTAFVTALGNTSAHGAKDKLRRELGDEVFRTETLKRMEQK